MNTIDLLLGIGDKLTELLLLLFKKRMSKSEKEDAKNLIEQYEKLKNAHGEISSVLHRYNRGLSNAIHTRSLKDVFDVCTHQVYQKTVRQNDGYIQHGVIQMRLDKLEVLTINIKTHTVKATNFSSVVDMHYERSVAYTEELWLSYFSDGSYDVHDVINRYNLILEKDGWKIESSDVYVKAK